METGFVLKYYLILLCIILEQANMIVKKDQGIFIIFLNIWIFKINGRFILLALVFCNTVIGWNVLRKLSSSLFNYLI